VLRIAAAQAAGGTGVGEDGVLAVAEQRGVERRVLEAADRSACLVVAVEPSRSPSGPRAEVPKSRNGASCASMTPNCRRCSPIAAWSDAVVAAAAVLAAFLALFDASSPPPMVPAATDQRRSYWHRLSS
jgi:hypothetical protein